MVSLRTPETIEKYRAYLQSHPVSDERCPLCIKVAIETFTFWKVTENSFPYDEIAKIHHMLIPLRHVKEIGLTPEEIQELHSIKTSYVDPAYDWIIEATHKGKSIPEHFHLHIIVGK